MLTLTITGEPSFSYFEEAHDTADNYVEPQDTFEPRLHDGVREKDDVLSSIGARITTGFLFNTRLQIDYNYNFGVIRQSEYGGHEVVAHFSGAF